MQATSEKESRMPKSTAQEKNTDKQTVDTDAQRRTIQQFGEVLDQWRSKIDDLMVQIDLADLDVRDEIRKRLETTENAYLAARSRLSQAVDSNLSSVRDALEQLIRDLRTAYDSTEAVVRRSRED
jgi:hypothetical protein